MKFRSLFLAAAFALAAVGVQAQQSAQGVINTQNLIADGTCTPFSCVSIDVRNAGSVTAQVTNAGTGALSGQVTTDGLNWETLGSSSAFVRASTLAGTSTIPSATNGVWQVAGFPVGTLRFRIVALGAVTGAAQVTLQTSDATAASTTTITGGGDATAANQVTGNFHLATIDGKLPVLGTQAISGSVSVTPATSSTWAATQSGTWNTRAQDGSGNALTSKAAGAERALSIAVVDGSGNQITSFGGSGGTSSNFAAALPSAGTAAGFSDGTNMQAARVADMDTGGGTQYGLVVSPRLSASGGAVELTGGAGAVAAGTLRTTQATDSPLVTATGTTGDTACASDNGTCSEIALIKRTNQNLTTLNTSVNTAPTYQGTPGSAAPASVLQMGARGGANSVAVSQGTATVAISVSTATTTQLVALASGQVIHVTSLSVVAGGTGNIRFVYGTGSNCGTGTTNLTGDYPLVANAGLSLGSGLGPALFVPAGNALCVTTSAAVAMGGHVTHTQFTP